ncbi:MAG: glycosyltransferase family 39 protein [Gemmatimonadota bacterium]
MSARGADATPLTRPLTPPLTARSRLAPWLVALVAFGAAVAAIGPWPVGVYQDDGIYVVLAKSLATGEGYRYLNMPGAPNAAHYPPLYPALLALLWKLFPSFPQNVTLFKFANAALLGGAAALFHIFARRRLQLGTWPAALAVVAFSACAPVILLTVMVLSEPMFLCGLAATLLACERAASTGRVRDAAWAGAAAATLALVRTLGILVVPATALVLLWRKQWRAAITLCVVAIVLSIPWQLWVGAHAAEVPPIYIGKYGSYLGWLVDAVRQDGPVFLRDVAWANLKSLVAQGWATTATDTLGVYLRNSTSVALALFFGMGMGGLLKRAPVAALFMAGYLVIVVVWPFAPARFTWGVWPLVGLIYALAAVAVWEWGAPPKQSIAINDARPVIDSSPDVAFGSPRSVDRASTFRSMFSSTFSSAPTATSAPERARRFLRPIALAALVALGVGYGGYNYLGVTRDWWTVVQKSVADRARPLAEWVRANTDSSAVLATDDDVLVYLYTGRQAIPNGAFTPQEHLVSQTPAFAVKALRTIVELYHPDFVLASTQYGTYAARGLVQATPPELRIVRALSTGAIFAPLPARSPTTPRVSGKEGR